MSELLRLLLPVVVRVVVAAAVVTLAAVVSIIMVDVALTPTRSSIRCLHCRLIDQIRYRDGHSMLVDLCLGAQLNKVSACGRPINDLDLMLRC